MEKKHAGQYLVGANYFTGWWREQPNKWTVDDRDWRIDYPERIPVLGCYNDQATMDAEIKAASAYGVDFFLILWYLPLAKKHEAEKHNVESRYLNNGLKQFIASPENHRMSFAVEYCNHPPFGIEAEDVWDRCCDEWVSMMSHPSYLKIGARRFFKVHGFTFESINQYYIVSVERIRAMYNIRSVQSQKLFEKLTPLLIRDLHHFHPYHHQRICSEYNDIIQSFFFIFDDPRLFVNLLIRH